MPRLQRAQPTISHHLRILRDTGLIAGRNDAQWIYYFVRDEVRQRVSIIIQALR